MVLLYLQLMNQLHLEKAFCFTNMVWCVFIADNEFFAWVCGADL